MGLWVGGRLPDSFVPDEDQGYFYLNVQLPFAASQQRTEAVMAKIQKIVDATPGVEHFTSITGFSLLSLVRTTYNGFGFISMKDWGDRKTNREQFQAIKAHLNAELSKLPEAVAFGFSPPAIPGVGTSGGVTFIVEDRSGGDVQFLSSNLNTFMAAARKRPEIGSVNTTFLPSVPQQFVTVDRDKVIKQQVRINDVYRTIQAFMGGLFINYFNRFGRQWQVYIEAEGDYRTRPENVGQFYVRNSAGEMVPLSALTRFDASYGPEFTMRFNEYRAAQLNVGAAPGYSTNQAMKALEETFAQTMPAGMSYDYSGMSFQEKKAQQGVSSGVIFGFSLLFVFLILAALYESWTLPFSVLLSTPVAVFGAFFDAMAAPRAGVFDCAALYGANRKRRVFADRSGHADRPGGQERDSDCRVRQGRVRKRQAVGRSRDGGRAIALAADSDDLVRLHPGVRAFVDCQRRRRRRPPDHGNHRHRRYVGGQRHWNLPGAGVLLRGRKPLRRGGFAQAENRSATTVARRRRLIMRRCACLAFFVILLAGCTVGPNYKRPPVDEPATFRAPQPLPPVEAASLADLKWFEVFKDDKLQDLIRKALVANYDLRDAVTRVQAARANLGITRSYQFPNFAASGNVEINRLSRNGETPLPPEVLPNQNRNFGTGVLQLLSFEIDIWGRLRRATEAARANLLSAEESRKAVVTTLVGDVATAISDAARTRLHARNLAAHVADAPGIAPSDQTATDRRRGHPPRYAAGRRSWSTRRRKPFRPFKTRSGRPRTRSICCSARIPAKLRGAAA